MFEEIDNKNPDYKDPDYPENRNTGKWIAGAAILALVAVNGFLFMRVNSLETQITSQHEAAMNEMAQVRDASLTAAQSLRAGGERAAGFSSRPLEPTGRRGAGSAAFTRCTLPSALHPA